MIEAKNGEIWAVASGKGGVGKTVIATGLAMMLQRLDKRVILIDCNLGSPNIHSRLGILRPEKTLNDFLSNSRSRLEDMLVDVPGKEGNIPNMKFISGSPGTTKLTDILPQHTKRLITGIKKLEADYVIMDLGPNPDRDTLDLYGLADKKILVLHVEDRACVESNYSFLMAYMYRKVAGILLRHGNLSIGYYRSKLDSLSNSLKDSQFKEILEKKIKKLNDIYVPLKDLQDFIKSSQNPKSANYSRSFTEFLERLRVRNETAYESVCRDIIPQFNPLLVVSRSKSLEEVEKGRNLFPDAMRKLIGIGVTYAGYVGESEEVSRSARTGKHFICENSGVVVDQFGILCGSISSIGKKVFDIERCSDQYVPEVYLTSSNGGLSSSDRLRLIDHCKSRFSRRDDGLDLFERRSLYERTLKDLNSLCEQRPALKEEVSRIVQGHSFDIMNNYFSPLLNSFYSNSEIDEGHVKEFANILESFGFNRLNLKSVADIAKKKASKRYSLGLS